ncbi:MAG TPA: DEAD/DEAH box helicase, partial [Lentisphaeria bacterium]|nr:DEAD/DEAH box helicase [Lentisphaeria bacterium]
SGGRLLVVQRTGWGKSIVYFIAAKLLREQGKGPALLISPLLSLMRNQLEAAQRMDVIARTINSSNVESWQAVRQELLANQVDILLISPERLANETFHLEVLGDLASRVGMFVIDEAHCISDWGHDFRPDYRRIRQLLMQLPQRLPILATTATANNRVVNDIVEQLGQGVKVMRGPLVRESLSLQNLQLDHQSERLAWLAEQLPKLPGSGIIYVLTQRDAERVAEWLRLNQIQAEAYHADLGGGNGEDDNEIRTNLEQKLLNNEIKALVATVALGMGSTSQTWALSSIFNGQPQWCIIISRSDGPDAPSIPPLASCSAAPKMKTSAITSLKMPSLHNATSRQSWSICDNTRKACQLLKCNAA